MMRYLESLAGAFYTGMLFVSSLAAHSIGIGVVTLAFAVVTVVAARRCWEERP